MLFGSEVEHSGRMIGSTSVEQEGLYYRIRCVFFPEKEGLYRVVMHCGGTEFDLGIGVPGEKGFELIKRIPAKRIPEGEYRFSVFPEGKGAGTYFVPVLSLEPFPEISRLRHGKFVMEGGVPGIRFPAQDRLDNDPSR